MGEALLDWRPALVRTTLLGAAVVAAVGIGLIAVISPKLALAAVLGLAFAAISLQNLAAGVALFTVLTFFSRVPGGGAVTGTKAAGAVLVISWVLTLSRDRASMPLLTRDRPFLGYALAMLFALALFSQVWANDAHAALTGALRVGQGALFAIIVFSAVRTGRDLKVIVWAFVIGAMLTAIVGLAGATHAETTTSGS